MGFEVIEKDEEHDLTLCKSGGSLKFVEQKDNPGTETPVASLRLSTTEPTVGDFITIAGTAKGWAELHSPRKCENP
jgi:hypothetical protein